MNGRAALLATGAGLLLLATDYLRRQLVDGDALEPPDWTDEVTAMAYEARNAITGSPVAFLVPSSALVAMLKRLERLALAPYRLGDGGSTIGYGRFYPDGGPVPPARIDAATAESWFAEDLEDRGARWVRAYVSVPLQQHQFDALVHMAFNLSPKSFRNIADAVNRGEDPEAQALRYVRAGTNLEAGLRTRRREEMNLYRNGIYA